MHFVIHVEDQSGKKAIELLAPRIVGETHTIRVYSYKGVGRIPKNMHDAKEASNRILLDNLPRLLQGLGRTQAGQLNYPIVGIFVCDLDDKCLKTFRDELNNILKKCNPKPNARFCIAIEEGEAWFLGDSDAIKAAYPRAKDAILSSYEPDSICGTWEKLADAVYPGGASALSVKGYHAVGEEKSKWADVISPHMTIDNNLSPSFNYFCKKLKELAGVLQ